MYIERERARCLSAKGKLPHRPRTPLTYRHPAPHSLTDTANRAALASKGNDSNTSTASASAAKGAVSKLDLGKEMLPPAARGEALGSGR